MKRTTMNLARPMPVLTAMHPGNPHGLRFAEGDAGDKAGGAGDGAGSETGKAGESSGGDPQVNEYGYPDKTPVADMTVEQQAAYWKHHARKHESTAKSREDYDTVKAERDQLKQATMTPDEKALEEARQAGAAAARAEERALFGKQLVATKLEAALSRRGLDEDRIGSLVGPLDHTYFLTDSGEVDADKVSNYAAGFGQGEQWPDTGQGRRGSHGAEKTVGAGRDLFRDRHQKK